MCSEVYKCMQGLASLKDKKSKGVTSEITLSFVSAVSSWLKNSNDFVLDNGNTIWQEFENCEDKVGFIQNILGNFQFLNGIRKCFPKIIINRNDWGNRVECVGNCLLTSYNKKLTSDRKMKVIRLAFLDWIGVKMDYEDLNKKCKDSKLHVNLISNRDVAGVVRILRLAEALALGKNQLEDYGLFTGNPLEFEKEEGVVVFADSDRTVRIFTKDCERIAQGFRLDLDKFSKLYNEDKLKKLSINKTTGEVEVESVTGDKIQLKHYLFGENSQSREKYDLTKEGMLCVGF